jgi:transposase-like protein
MFFSFFENNILFHVHLLFIVFAGLHITGTARQTRRQPEQALEKFKAIRGPKYGYPVDSWRQNWVDLTCYFDFPLEIFKIIYTTNTIEN